MGLNRQVVTVRRYTTDRYGNRTVTLTFHVGQCVFAPKTSDETNDRSTSVTTDAVIYAPSYAGFQPSDEVTLDDGTRWEVEGTPERWESPFSNWAPGVAVALTRVTG